MASFINIQPYTHKQLATMYEVSWKTLKRWLRPFEPEIGKKNGHFYTSRQVELIFNKLGLPKRSIES